LVLIFQLLISIVITLVHFSEVLILYKSFEKCSRYIDICYHYIKDLIENKQIIDFVSELKIIDLISFTFIFSFYDCHNSHMLVTHITVTVTSLHDIEKNVKDIRKYTSLT